MAAAGMLKGRVVVALYTYQGSEFGDMTFSKGDQMEIVDDTDPDWCCLFFSSIPLLLLKHNIKSRLLRVTECHHPRWVARHTISGETGHIPRLNLLLTFSLIFELISIAVFISFTFYRFPLLGTMWHC